MIYPSRAQVAIQVDAAMKKGREAIQVLKVLRERIAREHSRAARLEELERDAATRLQSLWRGQRDRQRIQRRLTAKHIAAAMMDVISTI